MRVNGVEKKLDSPVNIKTLLEQEGFVVDRVAVEKNGEIVPKASYEHEILKDDDSLEVVAFIGGG